MEETTPPLILEEPTSGVQKEAKFYPMMGGTLDGHLSYRRIGDLVYFPPVGDTSWHLTNVKRFRNVAIPDAMSAHWKHKVLTIDPQELEPFAPKLRINNDALIEHLPDIHPWSPFMIVSAQAKTVIEDISPEAAYFIPLELAREAGDPVEKTFHWCIVKNRLYFENNALARPIASVPFPGPFGNAGMVYEMENIPEIKTHLESVPIWGLGMLHGRACFSQSAFTRLKFENLTGLVENTELNFPAERKLHESIGHIA
jgi:hypothetical protein